MNAAIAFSPNFVSAGYVSPARNSNKTKCYFYRSDVEPFSHHVTQELGGGWVAELAAKGPIATSLLVSAGLSFHAKLFYSLW